MSSFETIYLKEYREHRLSLLAVFCIICTIPAIPLLFFEFWIKEAFFVALFYITATAAMSYAKEDEAKTARFLRMLPIDGQTLLRAKLAWLGTVMFVLFLPLVLYLRYALLFDVPNINVPELVQQGLAATLFALSWAFFWTTRYPSKIFATLLSGLCAIVTAGIVIFAVGLFFMTLIYFDVIKDIPLLWQSLLVYDIITIISLPFGLFGLRRMARYYQQPEPKNRYLYESGSTAPRWLIRLFPKGRWSPFTAMLWQSIGQSRDILLLGLLTALAFCLWLSIFLVVCVWLKVDHSYWENTYLGKTAYMLAFLIHFACGLSCLCLSATIFSRDQEGRKFRTFTEHGISSRLVWWSRILPFAAVYAVPLLFVGFLCLCGVILFPNEWGCLKEPAFRRTVSFILVFFLLPFSLGSFFSMFCRSILMSVILTFGIWFTLFCLTAANGLLDTNGELHDMSLIFVILFVIAFPIASQLMVGDWLREKPRWRSVTKLFMYFSLTVIIGIGSFCVFIWK